MGIRGGALIQAWQRAGLGFLLLASPLAAWSQTHQSSPPALRAAVPILCTENVSFRTVVHGTGLIADSSGTLITAAHVILPARYNCTLSLMIPDDEWTRTRLLRRFRVSHCEVNEFLDIAVCRTQPAESSRDLAYLRSAPLRFRPVIPGEPVWITGFTGWVLTPLTRAGRITGQEAYRRPDGCRCDFVTDIPVVEGMSGSPIISSSGEVLGIITQAGKRSFRGTSFGMTFDEAKTFLIAQGVPALGNEAGGSQTPATSAGASPSAAKSKKEMRAKSAHSHDSR